MDFAAPHTGFVIASYAISLAGLLVLVGAILWRDRRLARAAADLESRKRRGDPR
jgi:heme exporter protein CcmD